MGAMETGSIWLAVALASGAPGGAIPEDPAAKAELVRRYDADGDGRLNPIEAAAAREGLRVLRAAGLARFDADGDGALSATERETMLQTLMLERFRAMERAPRVAVVATNAAAGPAPTNAAPAAPGGTP